MEDRELDIGQLHGREEKETFSVILSTWQRVEL